MTTLYNRASPSQRRLLRIIEAATKIERLRAALTQIRGFAEVMQEHNWRDLRLHIQRQCDVLNEQNGEPPR